MNVKKTALATAIALTMAGGGSAWAETSTVKGQFILDKKVVVGGETVNLALLGLDKNGEVDRYGEEKGSVIMAVVNTIKGKIRGGNDRPGSTPDDKLPGRGYFASEVSYVELDQGVGRVNIYYPDEIVDADDTTDIVTVFLQERIPTGEGGVRFERIGQPVEKTITIKAGTKEPISFTIASFQPPNNDPLLEADPDKKFEMPDPVPEDWGLRAEMTAGYSGALIKILGDEDLQGTTRAAILVTLKVVEPNGGETIYTDTQRMIRGEALFTLTAEIQKAGLYDLIVSLEGKEEINNIRMLSKDTLRVWPRKTPQKSKLTADKTRMTQGAAAVFDGAGVCNGSQVCQGTKLTLILLDEFGNEITPHTNLDSSLIINVNDANKVVSNKQITLLPGEVEQEWTWGDNSGEILKTGTTSLTATTSGLANSDPVAIKVVNLSLKATPTALFAKDQKAGTEFNAFLVETTNNSGTVRKNADGSTIDPGKIKVTTSTGESIEVDRKRDDPVDVVEVYFETVAGDKYLISDTGGLYGQVWATGSKIIPAAAFKVTLHNAIGEEITTIKPRYDLEEKRYIAKLPEVAFRMQDAYGNEITENVGDFKVSTANATIKYVGTNGSFGETGRDMGGKVHVAYNPASFSGEDSITMTFNKPALSSKTLQITTTIPEALDTGLGSIKSFIETNDIPVNSEVALKVETLDKQDKLFKNASLVVTVTFNEEEEALAAIDLDPESDEPDHIITPTVYDLGSPMFDDNGNMTQTSNFVASGGRLTFGEGSKLFVVEVGPRSGKFSLTFKDANNPLMKDVRVFTVTNEIQITPPDITEPECLKAGNFWKVEGSTTECQEMADLTAGGAFVMGRDGVSVEKTARITGGTSIEGSQIASRAQTNLSNKSEVMFVGNIAFAPEHEGEDVDIIAVALYQLNPFLTGSGASAYFSLMEKAPNTMLWADVTRPGDIEPFYEDKHTIVENEPKLVEIYTGKFGNPPFEASTIDVWLGYRLDDGTVVFNPESIHLTLLP